jgi:hypothetical protein
MGLKRTPAPLRMTKAEYETMFAAQGGVCLLCGKRQRKQRLTRDHDHLTGRVRGLLCLRCNRNLGAWEWSDEAMVKLKRYLTAILADHLLYNAGLPPYDTSLED